MTKIVDIIIGLILGSLFGLGLLATLIIVFIILSPLLFYFIVKETLKQLLNK